MERALITAMVFVVTLASALLLVTRAIAVGHRLGLLDPPGGRRIHREPVPRTGGVPIFLAFAIGLSLSFSLDVACRAPEVERLLLLLAASAVIIGVMVVDDVRGIS